ncbi:MAG TPA: hypothetical protein VKR06_05800 [Ktedonosporobacter sp.]|nr:hypothetical protein [Ktedonosporobacter sp.]
MAPEIHDRHQSCCLGHLLGFFRHDHQKELLPRERLTDTNYAEASNFPRIRQEYGINLIAPTRADQKWQGQAKPGFDAASLEAGLGRTKSHLPSSERE